MLITFFLQFFPELVKEEHLYILQTPLFRVRNNKKTEYCYSEFEKKKSIDNLGINSEITRFKGLGEISPDEFKFFIGDNMRLDPIRMDKETTNGKPINSVVKFEFIETSKSKNIDQSNTDLTLELLAIDVFKKIENFEIILLFSKNRIITLTTEVIDVTLEDQKIKND